MLREAERLGPVRLAVICSVRGELNQLRFASLVDECLSIEVSLPVTCKVCSLSVADSGWNALSR